MDKAPNPALAQQATAIARQTMSPFCPGRTLYDCPSPNAAEWRRDIESMLAQGKTFPEIQATLAKRADVDLSGSPNASASYLWSVVGLCVALAGLVVIFRRLRPRPSSSTPKSAAAQTGEQADSAGLVPDIRLEEELEELK